LRNGMRFRLAQSAYRAELDAAIRSAERAPWLSYVVDFWLQWRREPEFPVDGSPRVRLDWVIRRHCFESRESRFYLSARCAPMITGTSFKAANNLLHRLVRDGVLKRVGKPLLARHAQEYRLVAGMVEVEQHAPKNDT